MKNYNKNAKLFYMIFLILGFALLLLSVSYMTQYNDIFVYKNALGVMPGEGVNSINNNASWATFINNVNGANATIEELKEYLGLTKGFYDNGNIMSTAFYESVEIIRNCYEKLQNVNWLIFYYFIVVAVVVAICYLFSNHSRRIYYKSNVVIGVLASIVVIGFGIYVFIQNTMLISDLNENHTLLNAYNYVCNDATAAKSFNDLAMVTELNVINSSTIIVTDIILALVIGYAAFMLVYTVRRYNSCERERKDIIAKAVSLDE